MYIVDQFLIINISSSISYDGKFHGGVSKYIIPTHVITNLPSFSIFKFPKRKLGSSRGCWES